MTDVSGTMFTVEMTRGTRHVVPVTEWSHPEVIQPGLQGVAKLVEGHRIGHVDCGQLSDLV